MTKKMTIRFYKNPRGEIFRAGEKSPRGTNIFPAGIYFPCGEMQIPAGISSFVAKYFLGHCDYSLQKL